MNKYTLLRSGLIFASGAFVGYLFGKKTTADKYEKIINEDLKVLEERMKQCEKAASSTPETVYRPNDIPPIDTPYEKPEYTFYSKCYESGEEDPAGSESPKEEDEALNVTNVKKEIKVIKDSEFGEVPNFAKQYLLYYTETDTLTITEGKGIEDEIGFDEIEGMIGDALTKFGFKTNDQLKICVRNYRDGCDYEISKVFGPYVDE